MPDTVVGFARNVAMKAFDRSYPLGELTLVEQLDGERAALVMKAHHSLTDGIGAVQLALSLFDASPMVDAPDTAVDAPRFEGSGTRDLVRASLAWNFERAWGFVRFGAGSLSRVVCSARHPVSSIQNAAETARSIGRTVKPVRETLSPIMKERSMSRHLEMLEVRLDDLGRAAAAAGGTVNDAFMAAVTGGLRRYHERRGASVDYLRVMMPISIRESDDPIGENHIALMRFVVPVSSPDAASRVREIGRLCRAARSERSLPFTDAIAGSLNLMPSKLVGNMLKHVDFVASDVPGLTFPVYLAGARVERFVAFGPTIGSSVNLTLVSYVGTCSLGVTIDTAAVPDPDLFMECLDEGFEEILRLAGERAHVHRP
jgi:WS/DGAT/MGAT family acyltransferase